jgi:phage terminase small subunit
MTKLTAVPGKTSQSMAPSHLKPTTRAWFDQVCKDFELESHHEKILTICAEAWDAYCDARDAIAQHGMTFVNVKHGDVKPRPEVAIMQNSRIAFLRALRELNLDVAPPETSRPSRLKYSK